MALCVFGMFYPCGSCLFCVFNCALKIRLIFFSLLVTIDDGDFDVSVFVLCGLLSLSCGSVPLVKVIGKFILSVLYGFCIFVCRSPS